MRAVDLIRRKRDGLSLDPDQVREFVDGATNGSWPDYQVSAFLMAVACRGMSIEEAAALTAAMAESGDRLDLRSFGSVVVDKHSTGGVGDKISLVLAPLAAACGLVVPMMSGRGLGHTGGTLDKLEAIPGFRTQLSAGEIHHALAVVGCAMFGQTARIAPADRRLYALRDVTATVESVPLIAASILSKKIAEGARGLVLDVKVGRGAFMQRDEDAQELAEWLLRLGESNGLKMDAVLSAMDAPLGRAVGNAPEVVEAVATLQGQGPADVTELSIALTARMLVLGEVEADAIAAERRARAALASGDALEKWREIVQLQGGDVASVDDPSRLPQPRYTAHVTAREAGVVRAIDAGTVGRAAVILGAGRDRVDAAVDPSAGIVFDVQLGDIVAVGDRMAAIHGQDERRVLGAKSVVESALAFGDDSVPCRPLIADARSARPLSALPEGLR